MRPIILLILAVVGCSNPVSQHFDEAKFKAVAERTMYAMLRTAPVELNSKKPLREMRTECGSFPFPPDEARSQLLTILIQAGYGDPMWAQIPATADDATKAGNESIRVRQSRRMASIVYHDCLNEYRVIHGGVPQPIEPDANPLD